jgi:hypothetical protein
LNTFPRVAFLELSLLLEISQLGGQLNIRKNHISKIIFQNLIIEHPQKSVGGTYLFQSSLLLEHPRKLIVEHPRKLIVEHPRKLIVEARAKIDS